MKAHTHNFIAGKSGTVATCACGAFRHLNVKPEDVVAEVPALLDCGHPATSTGHAGTGSATLPDGSTCCYACANAREAEALKTADRYTAYLTRDDKQAAVLTTWPGGLLARCTAVWETSAGGFARGVNVCRFRAVDVHGAHWFGTSPGFGMYARMRRAKG